MQFATILIALPIFLATYCESQLQSPKCCNVAYDCSYEENPVWASTSGQICEVFRNECVMMSENCDRLNENRPEAKKISQKKCQDLCRLQNCLMVYNPVCGIYNGKRRTFGNNCEMNKYICTTGQTFIALHRGSCFPDRTV
ncbi:U-Kazal-Dg21.2-like [Episyrphus balteatus]|uniref:U-Kazal-Dg21.2-like n=1 Tax=Episyrphus balteatus TaxID=286459 RepID=UPI00248519AC|nr:U-Kazal-Dg21.2-like [Episyrphus balteatus]